ncbi:hypothetical protein CcaCcLH18_08432 [Colletotrichum camelliae]|nr:hypothetical protein CcaCcLH18_08432 [Colletotrichum camelliae]
MSQPSRGRFSYIGTEQVIVLPNLSISVTKDEAYQIIIVPTGAVGASAVKREYPQIISFSWPDKMADKDLHSHEAANPEQDTYLSVLVKAMNDHLEPFNKAVIDVTSDTGRKSVIEQIAVLSPPTDSRVKSKTRGQLYLMNQGVFFNSQSHRVYLSFDSVEKAMTILAHDTKDQGKVAGLNLIFSATEPFYNAEEDEETNSQTLIKFVQVDHSLLDDIKSYMKQHRIELMLCEQSFYDYENDKPATGTTMPTRAIYFPVCQQNDEAYKQYCTYVAIDFNARDIIKSQPGQELDVALQGPLPITYLATHKLRSPEYDVYNSSTRTDELFLVGHAGRTWTASNFVYMDASFILDLVTYAVQFGLGFIPGAGPLLLAAFGNGLQLLNDPDTLKADNFLDISAAVLLTLIGSAGKSKKYVDLGFLTGATTSTRMASMPMAPMALTTASEADDMLADDVESIDEGGVAEKKRSLERRRMRGLRRLSRHRGNLQVLELKLNEAFRREGY